MKDRMDPGQADKIEELILTEKETAERSFDSTRFDTRLFERIRNTSEARPAILSLLMRKPGPVMAISALVLVTAGFLLFQRLSPSPFQQTVQAMSAVLAEAGDGQRASVESRLAQRIATVEYTDFGWALKKILYACERESLSGVELTDALSRVFPEGARQPPPGRDGGKSSFSRMKSFKLRSGEDYQMFFSGFLKIFEEV